VSGGPFTPGEGISLLLDGGPGSGYPVGHGDAGSTGALTPADVSFVVPALIHGAPVPRGVHQVYAYGTTSHTLVSAPFRVLPPAVSATPASVMPGAYYTASAGGFAPGETVFLYWDGDNMTGVFMGMATATTGDYYTGKAGDVSLQGKAPADAASGTHTIAAYGLSSGTLLEGVAQVVTLAVTPAKAAPGTPITVTARGYAPGEAVDVTFSNPNGQHTTALGQATATSLAGRLRPHKQLLPAQPAEVVTAALEQHRPQRDAQDPRRQRQVRVQQLLLQVVGVGRHSDQGAAGGADPGHPAAGGAAQGLPLIHL